MEEAIMIQDSGYDVRNIINPAVFPEFPNANFLVQFWKGNYKTDSLTGRSYFELRVDPNQTFHINVCDEGDTGQLSNYMTQSALCSIISFHNEVEGQREGGVISRVFWTGSPEMSPDISYYSEYEYPHRDFALSCGIRASFCFPFFNINVDSGWPDGVVEIVSTCNQGIGSVSKICKSIEGLGFCLPGFLSTNIRKYAVPEVDHLLDVVCQTFRFPLAQYWVAPDLFEALSMVHQFGYSNFENLAPWIQFKDACWHKSLTVGEGPLGNSCTSYEAFFCKNIAALSITNYPFAHYARNCGSVSCFSVFLCYNSLPCTTCVLEFFLPAPEMDIYYPQTLLNTLWATIKERLPNHMLASGKHLGKWLSVGVINSSTQYEAKSFEIGQPDTCLPHHEGSGYSCNANIFEYGTAQRSNSNTYEEAVTEEMLKRIPNDATEIICLEKPEDESHIKYIGPHSLASQPNRPINILQYNGDSNSVEIDHSAPEMITLEEPSKHKSRTTTAVREEPVEGSNVEDVEYATSITNVGCTTSNADIRYAITTGTAYQTSGFQTMNMPCQLGEEETLAPDDEDCPPRKSEEEISFESLSEHFGRPLDDAATSFGVSRSTFKRICRDVGIKRWQYRKRRMNGNVSSKLTGRPKDEEPRRKKFLHPDVTPVHDTVARTGQDLNKMAVKVTYKGINIRFKLPRLSGVAELEDNVIERLHLERKSFSLKYQDEEGDWVLIACDKDVQECMEISGSLKRTTIKLLLDPPINHCAP